MLKLGGQPGKIESGAIVREKGAKGDDAKLQYRVVQVNSGGLVSVERVSWVNGRQWVVQTGPHVQKAAGKLVRVYEYTSGSVAKKVVGAPYLVLGSKQQVSNATCLLTGTAWLTVRFSIGCGSDSIRGG